MPRRHLLVIEIEPEGRSARVDHEGMRGIAPHLLEPQRIDHLRALIALLPEAIIPGGMRTSAAPLSKACITIGITSRPRTRCASFSASVN